VIPKSEAPVQVGPALLVQDAETLHMLYFAIITEIKDKRRERLSTAKLQEMLLMVSRAYKAASGLENPLYVVVESDSSSSSHDDDWWTVQQAANELDLSTRQIRRIAQKVYGERDGRDWSLHRDVVATLKQQQDWKKRNGTREYNLGTAA
jgi:hypothetical protein